MWRCATLQCFKLLFFAPSVELGLRFREMLLREPKPRQRLCVPGMRQILSGRYWAPGWRDFGFWAYCFLSTCSSRCIRTIQPCCVWCIVSFHRLFNIPPLYPYFCLHYLRILSTESGPSVHWVRLTSLAIHEAIHKAPAHFNAKVLPTYLRCTTIVSMDYSTMVMREVNSREGVVAGNRPAVE